jgi:DNA-directed RNA polymerase specialized sigma24 family protein
VANKPTTTSPTTPDPAAFRTTRWTRVVASRGGSAEAQAALSDLCAAYYPPVVAFLRAEGRDDDGARELAHAFFAYVLQRQTLGGADPARGRFRSYLLGAVKNFLSHHREAARRLKRGGGAEGISLDDTDAGEQRSIADGSGLSPDAAFDRQWALTALARALEALRRECVDDGREVFFDAVKPWLTGEAAHGDQTALAARCGMNANALKVSVHRLKRRFRDLLKTEVAGTLDDPAAIEVEMRALLAALGS